MLADRIRISEENAKKEFLIETIEYFAAKYPLYRFITEDSVRTLCQKYGLVYGTIDRYTGTIPDKNLVEMENFKMDDSDRCYTEGRAWTNNAISYHSLEESKGNDKLKKVPLEMVAPINEFNTQGMKVQNYELMPQDPIVLEAVFYKGQKCGYLIQTAWGDEASDPLVKNSKMN